MLRSTLRSGASLALLLCVALFAASAASASVDISNNKTKNMNCSGGVCIPTAARAVLSVKDLTTMLATSDVKVFTGNGALNIAVDTSFSWTSGNRLTLSAYQSVIVKAPVSVAGLGGVTIVTNVAGNGGDFITSTGSIDFWDLGSSLIVNDTTYTLVPDIATLASDIAANPSGFYALAKDYDALQDGIYPHSPIQTPLQGTLLGLGHTIDHLSITGGSSEQSVGFFSQLAQGSAVANIRFTNASVTASDPNLYAGTLAGTGNGTIFGVYIQATTINGAEGTERSGGVVGQNFGSISKSQSNGTITGLFAGGITAQNSGPISFCQSSGSVTAQWDAGGIASGSTGDISDSQSSATVMLNSFGFTAGGLVGAVDSGGTIERSFATGTVGTKFTKQARRGDSGSGRGKKQEYMIGGLVGLLGGSLSDSYARGDVSVSGTFRNYWSVAGGLVGESTGHILRSYATGAVGIDVGFTGGVIGYDLSPPKNNDHSYWDLNTGVPDPSKGAGNIPYDLGLAGQTTARFTTRMPAGFEKTVWGQSAGINNGYPYLLANPPR